MGNVPHLAAAGVNLEELGAAAEPSWFAHVRSGQRLPLGPAELQETADHLSGIDPVAVLSDEACSKLLGHIELLTTLRELKDDGMDMRFCHGALPADAATVRSLADSVRDQIAAAAEDSADAAVKPGRMT